MKPSSPQAKTGAGAAKVPASIEKLMAEKVFGQPEALQSFMPFIDMYRAGLAPQGRPAGIFLLLGPTGTGKTRTVEALASALHGSDKNVLRIDCGEFQLEHEMAKLIGAPPGYLGHRETVPLLNQQRLDAVTTPECKLSIVLFDEIEKASSSLTRLLLGVLDKATLRLGDNTAVNFENSLIFLTSNLGAREMMKESQPDFGFQVAAGAGTEGLQQKLENIGMRAVRRSFSPEFVNRIDAVITYRPLDQAALSAIVDRQIDELRQHVNTRLGERCFSVQVSPESHQFLLRKGTSIEYGARELKRTIHKYLTQPLATLVASEQIGTGQGTAVQVSVSADGESLVLVPSTTKAKKDERPVVLLVDDNRDLLRLFALSLARNPWTIVTAENSEDATEAISKNVPDVIVFDYLLQEANGIQLAAEVLERYPDVSIVIATGGDVSARDAARCEAHGFPILQKPFQVDELAAVINTKLSQKHLTKSASK
jgi:ATP-dependent Clp protease ATP-binding subunit ClpA/CheY-like chemotaxis protein